MRSLLVFLVFRKTLYQCKRTTISSSSNFEGTSLQFSFKDNTSEMLLLISLSNRKFIINNIIPFEVYRVLSNRFFEFLVFLFKSSLKTGHYFPFFSLESQLAYSLLNSNSQVSFFDHVIHTQRL